MLAIVALAAIVRLWGLGGQPVLYFDSGVYLGEGAFLASAAQRATAALFTSGPANPLERIALATETGTDAHPPDIAKPAHAILLGVSMLLLGKTVLAGALVSALAGIGTVALTYLIGMRGWGPRVAIPAAILLAISGQHLVYSREPLVESDGLFFATLASLLYLRASTTRGLVLAGLVWGVAFACNNRLSYLPAVFVVAELARWPGWPGLIRRGVAIGVGLLTPLAAIEAAYLVARGIGRAAGVRTDFPDYAQQLVDFTRMNPPDRLRPDEWPTYFVDVALMDGLGVLALMLLGIGVLVWRIRRRPSQAPVASTSHVRQPATRADLLLAGSLLVPLALYSVYSTGEVRLRHFSLALPWVMLAAALGLEWLATLATRYADWLDEQRRGRSRPASQTGSDALGGLPASAGAAVRGWSEAGILVAMTGLLVLLAAPRVIALDSAPSGMAAVLANVGSGPVASTNGPVLAFFTGEGRTNARLREAFVNVPADLPALAADYPLLVVDMQAEVFAGQLTDLYAQATPRLTVANGNDAWYLADLLEHFGISWGGWDDLLAKWQANRETASQLRVYDLPALARDAGSLPTGP